MSCVASNGPIGPAGAGVFAGTEYLQSLECGPRRLRFEDAAFVGDDSCRNFLTFCPLAAGAKIDPTKQIVAYRVFQTGTNVYLRTELACDVGVGARLPTIAEIRDEVARRAPVPRVRGGGTRYVINAAIVFYADSEAGGDLNDVLIKDFPLAGHRLTAKLHLTKTVWDWGDGDSGTFTEGDKTGRPYDSSAPCESRAVCTGYVSHVFLSTGTRSVTLTAYWDVTVTIDGGTVQVPVTGGVFRTDPVGRAIQLYQARSILVRPR